MYADRECARARARKGLAQPHAGHFSEIALSGSHRLRSSLAAASVLFAHAVVIAAKNRTPPPLPDELGRAIPPE
jgi:hypothetical protein